MNLALGPVGIFVQLSLLQQNGAQQGLVYISLATFLYWVVSIPAAIVWGLATDKLHRRKLIIVTSYAIAAIYLFSFFFATSTSSIIFVYALISFISVASATPLNLLIMETEQKNRWAAGFARLSLMASVGTVLGYVLSAVWVQALPGLTIWLVVPLGLLAVLSTVLSATMIQEPSFVFERETIALQRTGLLQRLRASPLMFLGIPRAYDFRRMFDGLRNELTSYVPLLYLSIVLFYFASGVFNTSFVASLYSHSLTQSEVYTVNVVALVAQILAFQVAGRYIARWSLGGAAVHGLVLRGATYAALGVASVLVVGVRFVVPALILYPISSGIAYSIYYTASNTMIFNSIRGSAPGSTLGVYSAIVGVSTAVGSLASGLVSYYLGFQTTFVLAGALLGVGAFITARLWRVDPSVGRGR
jgi:MFS family permease